MADEQVTDEIQCRTLKEMLLYKMDRTVAVVGVVAVAVYAVYLGSEAALQVAMVAVGGLVAYLGVKGK